MARQHRLINGCDLVGKWLNESSRDRQVWIEEVAEADTFGFRNKPEHLPIGVKAPGTTRLSDFDAGFVIPIEELVGDAAVRSLVSQL